MYGRNGLMGSERPFACYRAMYSYRIRYGLPCQDGPLLMTDLAIPAIKMAVCRAIRSCCEGIVIAEECHFGFIDHVDFFALKLISDNVNELPMTIISTFEFKNGVICAQCEPVDYTSSLEVLSVVGDKIDNIDLVEFGSVDPGVIMPVNQPEPGRSPVGFDIYDFHYEVPQIDDGGVTNFTSVILEESQEATYVQMPLNRYISLEDNFYSIEEGLCTLKCEGGKFMVPNEYTGEYESKDVVYNEELDEYIPYKIMPDKDKRDLNGNVHVTVRSSIRYIVAIGGEYKRDPTMQLFSYKFSKQCKLMIDRFLSKLRQLPRTMLVRHNIRVLQQTIVGFKMPSRELLNQVALMVGEDRYCSKNYDRGQERWKPYQKWENWRGVVRRLFKSRYKFTSPLSIFDNKTFNYNSCDLTSAEERKIWLGHDIDFDARMTYRAYVEYCKVEYERCSNVKDKLTADRRRFLYYQFVESEVSCHPLNCQEHRQEDDEDYYPLEADREETIAREFKIVIVDSQYGTRIADFIARED